MKRILVTGGTGFLGKHLIEQLRGSGPIRVFCRGASPWDHDPEMEVVRGDINCREDVSRALENVSQVYHLAGLVSRDPKDRWLLYRAHVEGTRSICEAARVHRPEKIVLVSSSGTIAVSKDPVIHDERSGYKHDVVGQWAYYLSKIYTEKLALSYAGELPIVIANPALLLGPGDDRNSSTGDVATFLRGELIGIPLGGMSFVDARDVAGALIAAMRVGRPGERYLLGGPNWTFRHIIERVSQISGVRPPRLQLGVEASVISARILRGALSVIGKSLQDLDDVSIRMSALFWYCDSSKAASELGFRPRDPMVTLRDTVEDVRRRLSGT